MADEDSGSLDEIEEPAADIPTAGEPNFKVAYEKETRARKRIERELSFYKLNQQYGGTLDWDDFSEIPPKRWESLAPKLAAAATPAAAPQEASRGESQEPSVDEQILAKAQRLEGRAETAEPQVETLTALQAHKKYESGEWTESSYRDWMARQYSQR